MRDRTVTIGARRIELSNLDKLLFPASGITKGELVGYYRRIAGVALPHYRDRPLTMQRFPDGIGKEGFFQKDAPGHFPAWIDRVELGKKGGTVRHVVANDAATLVYLANQGCITPHLGLARADRPDHPDRMILDLDPSDGDFDKVRRAAKWAKALLDEIGLPSFVQTTGLRGLHVVVPLDRSAAFDEVREVARRLAAHLAERHCETLTVEQRKERRGNRVFVDYLRNGYGQTAVAPYAVRAIEGAPVATPIRWEEVDSARLGPRRTTIRTLFRRLGQTGDPWSAIAAAPTSLKAAKQWLCSPRGA